MTSPKPGLEKKGLGKSPLKICINSLLETIQYSYARPNKTYNLDQLVLNSYKLPVALHYPYYQHNIIVVASKKGQFSRGVQAVAIHIFLRI